MSMRPKDVVQCWVEAFNRADADTLARFYTEDAINHQVPENSIEGREAIRRMFTDGFATAKMVCLIERYSRMVKGDPRTATHLAWAARFLSPGQGKIVFQRGYWDK